MSQNMRIFFFLNIYIIAENKMAVWGIVDNLDMFCSSWKAPQLDGELGCHKNEKQLYLMT